MPKPFFRSLPTIEYDINDDGTIKLATNILTRIARKSNLALDGSVFYNYPMQDGDTVEIIADKYYGNSKYHWVVMLINNAYNNIYDFPLSGRSFSRYIKDKYGSQARAEGISVVISDTDTYTTANVYSESFSEVQNTSSALVQSGTIPAGETTTIKVTGQDPFTTLEVGDEVELFVPYSWHDVNSADSSKLGYAQSATVLAKSRRSDGGYAISTNIDSSRYPDFNWALDGWLRVLTGNTDPVVGTGATANTSAIFLDTGTPFDTYATNAYITFTDTPSASNPDDLIGNNFPIFSYDPGYDVLILDPSYQLPEVFQSGWSYQIVYGGEFATPGSTPDDDIFIEGENVTLRSGIHHFEMDVYDDSGDTLLLENHRITKNEYVDPGVGIAANKRIVNNYDSEVQDDNDKRNVILLRQELLATFLDQFDALLDRN